MSKSAKGKSKEVVTAAHGEATGKPSMDSIRSKVQAAIQEDPRFDTDKHGYPEGSPQDYEPYVVDILVPDDDGKMDAVIQTDDGRLVRHGFTWDGDEIKMDEGDSVETERTMVYCSVVQQHTDAIKAKEASDKEAQAIADALAKAKQKSKDAIHCRAEGIEIKAASKWELDSPVEFQWMPAGITTVIAGFRGKPINLTVECTEDTANIVQASLAEWKETFPKQEPFGCIEHREEEAALRPQSFGWKDDPEPGVFCTALPTELGARNVNGRIHRSWSPSFTTDAEYAKAKERGGVLCFPEGVRGSEGNPAHITGVSFSVGSLTNKPAFKNILPVRARQAEPQPETNNNADSTQGLQMEVKLIKSRGSFAAGSYTTLAADEAVKAIAAGEAMDAVTARRLEAQDTELSSMRAEKKANEENSIKAAVARAKGRNAVPPKDEAVQAKALERYSKGAPCDMLIELIDGMHGQEITAMAQRWTRPARDDNEGPTGQGLQLQGVSLREAGDAYIKAREPQTALIRGGRLKDAIELSVKAGQIANQHLMKLAAKEDFVLRDAITAADTSDPDAHLGTLATGLVLMRNLGYLKNKLAWLPFLTTDLSNEPIKFGQNVITRYITPPAVLTYVPGVGYTSDATTIATASGQTAQNAETFQATPAAGNLYKTPIKSIATTTDKAIVIDQHKGVEIEFSVNKLGSTVRNLFAEQQSAQLYSLAETINQFVLAKIFAATWTGTITTLTRALANWNLTGMIALKNALTISKVPDVGRFALLHSFYHDKLLEDSNLLSAKAILALITKDASSFEQGDVPSLFGVKPLESQLSAADNTGALISLTDSTNIPAGSAIGFAGNMSSMLFASRLPSDYTQIAAGMGIPATAALEVVTEPDSGLSMIMTRYVNHEAASVNARGALMYGAAQGDPRVGIVLKAS